MTHKYPGPPGPKTRAQRMREWSENVCPQEYLTTGEVASLLGWSIHRTRNWLKVQGLLRRNPGRSWYLVPRTAVRDAFPDLWQEYMLTKADDEDDG